MAAGTGSSAVKRFTAWLTASAALPATSAFAQSTGTPLSDYVPVDSLANNTIMFPIFMGAFAFAMWSATWLIRARRQLEADNRALALEHADLRARHSQAQALLDVADQRVVIWRGRDQAPACRGSLPVGTGAPQDESAFVAFGTWLTPESAQAFEQALERLRSQAEAFDLTVKTQSGAMIEAQGRTSGSLAFVRFFGLAGDRAALAHLEMEHAGLLARTETLKSLLEGLGAPVWMRGPDGSLTFANEAYVSAVEGASLDAVATAGSELLDSATRERMSAYHTANEAGGGSRFSDRVPATIARDRRIMDVTEVSNVHGTAGMAVDMSEVEEVQAHLRRTIEGHAQTMHLLATAVATFDEKKRLIFHNQAFETLWQLEPGQLEGQLENGALFDRLRDAGKIAEQPDWSRWRNTLLEIYDATQPAEHWWQLPDGRTLRVAANPHRQGGVTWVFENITEQLEMESRYIALTKVQGETLDHLSEAIAVFAPNGRLKLSNPSFQKMWDLEDEQVAAETPIGTICKQCRDALIDGAMWDTFVTGVTGVSDLREPQAGRATLVDGAVLDYALVPLPNGQTMLTFADVSAGVHLEQTLLEKNEALEAAERLKNEFIKRVSYEFRAPLTSIKGFSELLASHAVGQLNEKQADYVGDIGEAAEVLHVLVDNLLDLATVDAGIMELDREPMRLPDAVHAAARSVNQRLKDKGVRITISQPPKAAEATFPADAARVQQVLVNLLVNAINFTPRGGMVTLATQATENEVSISVSDEGPGVPLDQQDRIFQRFNSFADSTGRRGVGLGLSIAQALVELHGGTIDLDSTVETGARFVCTFPRYPRSDRDPVAQAAQ